MDANQLLKMMDLLGEEEFQRQMAGGDEKFKGGKFKYDCAEVSGEMGIGSGWESNREYKGVYGGGEVGIAAGSLGGGDGHSRAPFNDTLSHVPRMHLSKGTKVSHSVEPRHRPIFHHPLIQRPGWTSTEPWLSGAGTTLPTIPP